MSMIKLRYGAGVRLVPAFFAFFAVVSAGAHGRSLPSYNAYYEAPPSGRGASRARAPGRITGMDEQRGVPAFLWINPRLLARAPAATARGAAWFYLRAVAGAYGLGRDALGTAYIHRVHDTGRGGVMVEFRQRVGGVEVMNIAMKLLMARDMRLLAISGSLHSAAVPRRHTFTIAMEAAVASALSDVHGVAVAPQSIHDTGKRAAEYRYLDISPTSVAANRHRVRMTAPARAKAVLFALPDRLVPGYAVELLSAGDKTGESAHRYVIAADDGRALLRQNLAHSDVFSYRVWAEPSGDRNPLDGPQADYTPHPAGVPDGSAPPFVAPALVSVEGLNTNPQGIADPWLPANAVQTVGNHVDAYADRVDPDGYTEGQDIRATTTAPNVFDHGYDTALDPLASDSQAKAAVTHMFYVTNRLHDSFYDSGFDELTGNAQQDNYGRGGLAGDPLLAEAQDAGGRNNANIVVPWDGMSPRMQMFLWDGEDDRALIVNGERYINNRADFGPQVFTLAGTMALADDGAGVSPHDACEPISTDLTGTIALIERGNCSFVEKALNAAGRGAVGVLIADHLPEEPPTAMGTNGQNVPIPGLSISYEDGRVFKAALLGNTALTTTMQRLAGVDRDGAIDSTIVAHEWGHYLHRRLSFCGDTPQCLAQSEGWADFVALHMLLRESDDLDGAYPIGGYVAAARGDSYYFGLRRAPYSVDPGKNAMSFRHIQSGEPLPTGHPRWFVYQDNAEVHNAGEIWGSMMFEAYIALLRQTRLAQPRYSFADAKRRMADYVVLGMRFGPVDATFTEQRDALLAAALASDPQDYMLIYEAFARRGAGTCAESPTRFSFDLTGVVEDTQIRPVMEIGEVTLSDAVLSCDMDGNLDSGERGLLRVRIDNTGAVPLSGTELMVAVNHPNVALPAGGSVPVAAIAPFSSGEVVVEVEFFSGLGVAPEVVDFTVTLSNPATCEPAITRVISHLTNLDPMPATADDLEYPVPAWIEVHATGTLDVWSRAPSELDATNHVLYAVDHDSPSDSTVVSPPLQVGMTDPLVMTFVHRHQFESAPDELGDLHYYDGAVIEVSRDNGISWEDFQRYVAVPYNGVLFDEISNALANRAAFVGNNPAWPDFDMVTLDLGTQWAGESVIIRFRAASDVLYGDFGWEIDDIVFQGLMNQPFNAVSDNIDMCVGVPMADAGPDQRVMSGAAVRLEASGSADPDGDPLRFRWRQLAGPDVMLVDADTAMASFIAPVVIGDTVVTLAVTASDGNHSSLDSVDITVLGDPAAPDAGMADAGFPDAGFSDAGDPDAGDPDAGDPDAGPGDPDAGDGGCCQTSASSPGTSPLLALLVMVWTGLFSRRRSRK